MKELIQQLLEQTVTALKQQQVLPEGFEPRIQVDRTKDKAHGDLATNLALMAAKPAGKNPRELAQLIVDNLPASALVEKTAIAGPGFINFYLNNDWLASQVEAMASSPTANVKPADKAQTIVVDYSAPNVAKEMHVGHLRSTIIGDAVVRTLEFLGHKVVRANHIGDWGTQFGMLIANLEEVEARGTDAGDIELADLEVFYRESKARYDSDEVFAERARNYVVKLQSGDEYCNIMWRKLVDITLSHNQAVYDRLNVSLTKDDVMGESMYNPMLNDVVADLKQQGLAVEDNGATVVFLDEYKNKDGDPMGVIIQKKDGGFLYTTTDIACAKYRYQNLNADRVLYFIDSRQHQHLMQAWNIVRKAGYVPEEVPLEHHAFGMMLGKDGRPFKTRSGGTVKLVDLLEEAEQRAQTIVAEKSRDLDAEQQVVAAKAIAMGAVKYADLSKNRTTDYIFDWENMLAFNGNTAPYLQYAYTRIQSIIRRSEVDVANLQQAISLEQDAEIALAQKLIQFSDAVHNVANKGMPHMMCNYLYELAGAFMTFYEACPILKDDVAADTKSSRLRLASLTAKVLDQGLSLLGIETLERM
ncbi:arginine--tRNA ligase [Agarivorans sp. B2Z047]|uniref:arginine--tRNA ligase n=1 Tax=Agarivorans sp. B2Z047 TaxID=2652721 RepID=UPI00128CF90B|nr:arginine--tRNA ligase [Agarivorans sp. B2Z047]MPW30112.1 arginine--tRNA ligase [Agarivorans sp. B2Z047]UQN43254.1 arginine--tRNA ligase [Agarivorans sp. B2Z047]